MTSIWSKGTPNNKCASMTSRPLLTNVAELVVTTRPIFQVGWASASAGVISISWSLVLPRNGPPLAVRTSFATSCHAPAISAWARAECSESTGTICPGAALSVTSVPPTIKLSLLASANVAPVSNTARVGSNPTDPVMPLTTTSASTRWISSTAAPAPSAIWLGSRPHSAACVARSGAF
ncbi:MAG: Uncharacterised protein [Cellulomonadaceae bacterium TMED98]|nr:MAG: Uncharacterised protein [Cellulomonadaceae bacterium TMED98]